jgi:protein TonB
MPHALLLSPDDQAVNAITAVLEEMSVTCERPLDGASAAQKLNSHSFDLVLVDCENLPAAKLIFDVCRRGKTGNNPVPIAIVDGRAGLPTAFRLGAEQILTKPVARDQARNTIRTAVSRVRKDVQTNEHVPEQPASDAIATTTNADVPEERAQAAAAAAGSSQLTSFAEPAPSFFSTLSVQNAPSETLTAPTPTARAQSAVAEYQDEIDVAPASPKLMPQAASQAASVSESPVPADYKPKPPLQASGDPVPAEPQKTALTKSQKEITGPVKAAPNQPGAKAQAPVSSSYLQGRKKTNGPLVALLMLTLAGGGLYAAWMFEPGFRAIAQPQIDRLLILLGMALPPGPSPTLTKPSARVAPATPAIHGSGSPTPPTQIQSTRRDSAAGSATGPATSHAASSAPAVAKPKVKSSAIEADTAATPSGTQLPGESSAIILSSKGAENRLAQSAPPIYPIEAHSGSAEGTVVLKEVVDENGKVEGVRLVEGDATLATAAIKAVKQWRYRPYLRDGKAQPFQTVVIIDFQRP